jgi:hypothetical protein
MKDRRSELSDLGDAQQQLGVEYSTVIWIKGFSK